MSIQKHRELMQFHMNRVFGDQTPDWSKRQAYFSSLWDSWHENQIIKPGHLDINDINDIMLHHEYCVLFDWQIQGVNMRFSDRTMMATLLVSA